MAAPAMNALLAARAAGGISISDSFDRTDSASTLGNADTGEAWTAHQGTWGISGNTAYDPTNADHDHATVDTGETAMVVSVVVSNLSGAHAGGILARYVDSNNFYLADGSGRLGGEVRLFKRVSGSYTSLGTSAAFSAGDSLALSCNGSTISVLRNGSQVISVTDSAVSGTRAGLRGGYDNSAGGGLSAVRWNDFLVESP